MVGCHTHQHLIFVLDTGHKLVKGFEAVVFIQVDDLDLCDSWRFFGGRQQRRWFDNRGDGPGGDVAVDLSEHNPAKPLQF